VVSRARSIGERGRPGSGARAVDVADLVRNLDGLVLRNLLADEGHRDAARGRRPNRLARPRVKHRRGGCGQIRDEVYQWVGMSLSSRTNLVCLSDSARVYSHSSRDSRPTWYVPSRTVLEFRRRGDPRLTTTSKSARTDAGASRCQDLSARARRMRPEQTLEPPRQRRSRTTISGEILVATLRQPSAL